jgi:hypothetical protein
MKLEPMLRDDFVYVMDQAFAPKGKLTLEQYAGMSHISVGFGHGIATLVQRAWAKLGLWTCFRKVESSPYVKGEPDDEAEAIYEGF